MSGYPGSTHLMNPDRPAWKDPQNQSDAEKASAIDGFVAYCGRYEIDEANKVMYHYPEVAWSPNYVGTKRPRPYKFKGDLLIFSDKVTNEPGVESYSITWRKVVPSAGSSNDSSLPSQAPAARRFDSVARKSAPDSEFCDVACFVAWRP